jgi:hypothetical protein
LLSVADEISQRWIAWPYQFTVDSLVPCAYKLYGREFNINDNPVVVLDAEVETRERDYTLFVRQKLLFYVLL